MFVKVAVIYSRKSKDFVGPIIRAKNYLHKNGFDLQFYRTEGKGKLPEADMIMVDGYSASEHLLDHYDGLLITVLEKADSASVFFRKLLKDPRVDTMLKVSKLHHENENHVDYRFEELYSGGKEDDPKKVETLSTTDLKKIQHGPNFFMYSHLAKWQNIEDSLEKQRNNSVHCVVSTENYSKNIRAMRKKAVKIVKGMKGIRTIAEEGRSFAQNVYKEQLIDTKVVVAPFGNGYMSYRMAEAMLAGCVVVCPDCSFATSAGNPLQEEITYVSCRPDFENLEETIQYVLDNWHGFLKLRQCNQKLARKLYLEEFVGKILLDNITNLYIKHPFS